MVEFHNSWDSVLKTEFASDYYRSLKAKLESEYANYSTSVCYPPMADIFNAFRLCSYNNTKCVILGQDPYPNPGQAHGLSFSVPDGIRTPQSLQNIYKEIFDDLGIDNRGSGGNLTGWAKQGVLLLNAIMSVRAGQPGSHSELGWQIFTDHVISLLNQRETPLVFMLWGNFAKSKQSLITNPNHLVLTAAHPSPRSAYAGFFGCKHFSKANNFLTAHGVQPIDWSVNPKG